RQCLSFVSGLSTRHLALFNVSSKKQGRGKWTAPVSPAHSHTRTRALESELQSNLNLARPSILTQPAEVRVGGFAGGSIKRQVCIQPKEIWVVENVEHLRAELNAVVFEQLPILIDREIDVANPG